MSSIKENFFVDGKFYKTIEQFVEDELCDVEIENLSEDYEVKCERSSLLPIIQYNAEMIAEMAEEFSEENCDDEYETILEAVRQCVDFEKLNSMIPKLYYGNVERFVLTKKDLL